MTIPLLESTPCDHRDAFGSTILLVQDRPQDGVCMLCDTVFLTVTVAP